MFLEHGYIQKVIQSNVLLTSPMLISASVYKSPFCKILSRAAGGTRAPFIFDWEMWDSIPNV